MAADTANDAKALRQSLNEATARFFGVAVGSFIGLFILGHWVRFFYHRYSKGKSNQVMTIVIRLSRRTRSILCKRFFGCMSLSRVLLYTLYWGINIVLSCTNVDLSNLVNVAKRLGWVATCNLAFVIFLSLKNTPLAVLSASSYETLMPLHKAVGYTCIAAALVHAIVYLDTWAQTDSLSMMLEINQIAGMMGGIALFLIGVSTLPYILRQRYELFYIMHVALSAFILIVVALHRPDFSKHTIIIILFAASLLLMDRVIRFVKFTWNFMGNYATLTTLANGATRVRLRRSPNASPGSHAFLWLPAVRFAETHPFTLISSDPVEFVIHSRDGFTSAVHQYARDFPGKALRCSLNAGYGQPPDFKNYDSILLIAGGSGASFTFAVALHLSRNPGFCPLSSITFVWVLRSEASLSWFYAELRELLLDSRIKVMVHITENIELALVAPPPGPPEKVSHTSTEACSRISLPIMTTSDPEKAIKLEQAVKPNKAVDPEKAADYAIETHPRRPSIPALMEALVENADPTKRVIVGACGPESLLETVKSTASKCIRPDGPSFTLYIEGFKW